MRFTYDPLGRRVTKHFKEVPVIPYSDTESISNRQIEYHHRYLYSGDNIVAIYDNDTEELLATLLHDETIDTPLSISVHPKEPLSAEEHYHYESLDETEQYLFNQSRIHTYYYHRDHQNSILSLTDKEGKIIESYRYDAYGNITHTTKTVETYNPYGYTGRETDTDDLYYYRARYYDPTIGRFITPDPIEFAGGDTNFYRYVGNDPVNFRDDSGFSAVATGGTVNPSQQTLSQTASGMNVIPPKPKSSNGGGSAQTNKGDGAKIIGTPPKPKEECCKKPVPAVAITPGSPAYYENRYNSFITRHKPCANRTPPIYYMGNGKEDKGYGYKYCNRFLTKTYQNLSPAGQKWLKRVLIRLQIFMEEGIVKKSMNSLVIGKDKSAIKEKIKQYKGEANFLTGIECRSEDHRLFAFATHPDAYMPKRMAKELTCSDLVAIGRTPDFKEWHGLTDNTWSHAGDTWSQAGSVMYEMGIKGVAGVSTRCAKESGNYVLDGIKNKASQAADAVRDMFK
jgi:RHS repeat-associated protein